MGDYLHLLVQECSLLVSTVFWTPKQYAWNVWNSSVNLISVHMGWLCASKRFFTLLTSNWENSFLDIFFYRVMCETQRGFRMVKTFRLRNRCNEQYYLLGTYSTCLTWHNNKHLGNEPRFRCCFRKIFNSLDVSTMLVLFIIRISWLDNIHGWATTRYFMSFVGTRRKT